MRKSVHLLRLPFFLVFLLPAGNAGCQSDAGSPDDAAPAVGRPSDALEEGVSASIELTSPAFEDGEPIPTKYTEDGADVSPPLAWSDVPEGTKELALICDDPDAPSPSRPREDPWVHWVAYKIPADVRALPEGVPGNAQLGEPSGALQGKNSWNEGENLGYRGPAPPKGSGKHRYFFKLYALDTELSLGPERDKESLVEAMSGHVIGKGQLVGTYER
jgi:Raf kinase inhibitor-like YbhB/YbcL family protein